MIALQARTLNATTHIEKAKTDYKMKVLKQGNYVFVLYLLYQYLEHHKADYEKLTTTTLLPGFFSIHQGMSSTSSRGPYCGIARSPRRSE